MARYIGPKCRWSRREGTDLGHKSGIRALEDKCKIERAPGVHWQKRARTTDYGVQLRMKQTIRRYYEVLEKQFRRYIAEASRMRGNTGEVLLQLLEQRLDNVLRRAGFVRTIWAARQMVVHGHILVNGKKVDRPSFAVKAGDVISLRPKAHNLARQNMETLAGHIVSEWLNVNPAELTCTVVTQPTPDQIPFDVNTNLIVEFYR